MKITKEKRSTLKEEFKKFMKNLPDEVTQLDMSIGRDIFMVSYQEELIIDDDGFHIPKKK